MNVFVVFQMSPPYVLLLLKYGGCSIRLNVPSELLSEANNCDVLHDIDLTRTFLYPALPWQDVVIADCGELPSESE